MRVGVAFPKKSPKLCAYTPRILHLTLLWILLLHRLGGGICIVAGCVSIIKVSLPCTSICCEPGVDLAGGPLRENDGKRN